MSNIIKIKTGSGEPATDNIQDGELAYDKTNKDLYIGNGENVDKIGFSGSYTDLTDVPNRMDDVFVDDSDNKLKYEMIKQDGSYIDYDIYDLSDIITLTDNIADYVVEQGTSGAWTYRKWNNGFCELWGTVATGTLTCTASGNVYYTSVVTFSVPTFLKSSIGIQFTTANAGVLGCARYGTLSNNQMSFRVHRSTNNTSSLNINVAIQGTWG